ncbi:MAG: Fic family protein [Actinobacteria bacterium]|nr:Fic family protein [Actinomycetota bacterium]
MSDPVGALRSLAEHERIAAASAAAREACTQLRWHQALRRRIPEAAAESRVRGAWASAELDGSRSSIALVRDLMRGARPWSPDPDPGEEVLRAAVSATAATERYAALAPFSTRQVLAGVHLAAAGRLLGAQEVGRPRTGDCGEFALLGPAPAPAEAAARLAALDAVVAARDLPAVLVLAIVHAELAHARPFARGNGLVARAMDRVLARVLGLDPTGVAVLEAGHGASGGAAYQGALQAYGLGTVDGLVLWVEHCGEAIVAGAQEGHAIADSVLAGRLSD